jgi:hypothetical protein
MIKQLDALYEVTSKFNNFTQELSALDKREAKAREDLQAATKDGPIDSPSVVSKVSALNTLLDTIASRRGHIGQQTRDMLSELLGSMRATERAWMAVVDAHIAVIVERWVKVNKQFYPDGEEGARWAARYGDVPGMDELRRELVWKGGCDCDILFTVDTAIPMICHLIRHIKKHCDKVNLALPDKT